MDQIGDELKKVLKAGLGAVATGVDMAQKGIEALAQKGEPIYEQAKSAVVDAADKVKQAYNDSGIADVFSCRPRLESLIEDCRELTQKDLDELRRAIDEIYPTRPSGREEAAEEESDDSAEVPEVSDEEEPPEETPEDPNV